MRLVVYGDVHFSSYSSILRKRGTKFSKRLEGCINSINWAEQFAIDTNADAIVCLGDFFDRSELNSEEVTAFSEIKWNKLPHYFLVGNHETSTGDLSLSTAHLFSSIPHCFVIDSTQIVYANNQTIVCFLPYILNQEDRKMPNNLKTESTKCIVFSHNDIKGIQMGQFISKDGLDISDIENNCDLFINGHLHNGQWQSDKILNLGNLTGQNFSENADTYTHCLAVVDTDTLQVALYENPYAFNFYKLDFTINRDYSYMYNNLKNNSVLTIKVNETDVPNVKKILDNLSNIIEYKIITVVSSTTQKAISEEDIKSMLAVDHIQSFKDYCIKEFGKSDALLKELGELQ